MPFTGHSEFLNLVGSGLASANALINTVGNGTYQAANTTIAQWKATNLVQAQSPLIHEELKCLFQSANRFVDNLNAIGAYTDTDVAASDTTALWEARFTAGDPSFPANYQGARSRSC